VAVGKVLQQVPFRVELRQLKFTSDQELVRMQPKGNAPGHRNASGKIMSRPDQHGDADAADGADAADAGAQAAEDAEHGPGTFAYLRRMHMDSVSKELLEKLRKEQDDARAQLEDLNRLSVEALWLRELDALAAALDEAEQDKRKEYYAQAQSVMTGDERRRSKPAKGRV